MYKLNETSLPARFYSWIWDTNVTKFKTMCPYFWLYTLTILFLPLILIGKLIYYVMPAKKKIGQGMDYISESKVGRATNNAVEKITNKKAFWRRIGTCLKWTYFIIVGAVLLFCLIGFIHLFWVYPIYVLATIGGITLFILTFAGLIYLFSEHNLGHYLGYPFRLFKDMVVSTYNNWCPLINWN